MQHRLHPMLLALGHRHPEGARRQRGRPRVAPVRRVVADLQWRRQTSHFDVHPLQAPHERADLPGLRGLVGAQEVVAHPDVGHLLHHLVARFVDRIRLQHAALALRGGLDPRAAPVAQDRVLVRGRLVERGPLRQVLLEDPPLGRVAAGLLERHARGAEAVRRHRVAVAGVEEVVDVVVEVRDPARVELVLHRRPVQVVDPAHRLVGDLVVDRVRVGREEVAGGVAHLVRIDEQHGRVAAQHLDLAVRFRLRAGKPVAVHVEPVCVAPRVGLAAVGVLRRQDHHDRLVEDP